MTTNYIPREGSVAARALEILVARGIPMSASDICDEIDSETGAFWANISIALREGVIASTKIDGRVLFAPGNGEPITTPPSPPPKAAKDEAPPPTPRSAPPRKYAAAPAPTPVVDALLDKPWRKKKRVAKPHKAAPAKRAKPSTGSFIDVAPLQRKQRAKSARRSPPQAAPINAAIARRTGIAVVPHGAPHSGLQCALFNTGDLLLEVSDGASMRLSRDQARELVAYLDRIANAAEPA